jgi:alpha-tubulin suppressor-like RCC1 family protein
MSRTRSTVGAPPAARTAPATPPSPRARPTAPVALCALLACAALACRRSEPARPPTPLTSADCPPVPAGVLRGVTHIRAGGALTCAIADGKTYCWGINKYGEVGDGFTVTRGRPTLVNGLEDAVELSPDTYHVFARDAAGRVWVWGRNDLGTFGDGSPDYHIAWEPLAIPAWGKVRAVRAGIPACALDEAGAVQCAGLPRFRTVEDGAKSPVPARIHGLADVSSLGGGAGFTCVVDKGGRVLCWGDNAAISSATAPAATGTSRAPSPASPARSRSRRARSRSARGCATEPSSVGA